ncbi:CsiV family protein [Ferrimonas marina]|uniref:Peptidoglycan-binding protein, CsiV n=1 Tax=Ferrimonas marina TaxID=299255 RepID=A0A1M5YQP8_9GAMM|nr:CsiV family protein [Ferrimonas marina]SHI14291.1 Peptidoglycan-binding protein, CsiV [Ferrimonas marina]
MNALIRTTLAALTALAMPVQAEDPTWFEVELLVFSRADASSEHWSDDNQPAAPTAGLDLLGPTWLPDVSQLELALNRCSTEEWLLDAAGCEAREQPPTPNWPTQLPIQAYAEELGDALEGEAYLLPRSMLEFEGAAQQLSRQGKTLLLHTGWQMPVYGRRAAQPFELYAGRNYGDRYGRDGHLLTEQEENLYRLPLFSNLLPEGESQDPVWQLDGWLRIYLDHFLFIESRLDLRVEGERQVATEEQTEQVLFDALPTEPDADSEALAPTIEPYLYTISLDQSRRVRSREIHYFDHPQLGLVVQIRRMEQPQPPSEESETALSR